MLVKRTLIPLYNLHRVISRVEVETGFPVSLLFKKVKGEGRDAYSRGLVFFLPREWARPGRALIRGNTVSQTHFVAHDSIVIKLNISI